MPVEQQAKVTREEYEEAVRYMENNITLPEDVHNVIRRWVKENG